MDSPDTSKTEPSPDAEWAELEKSWFVRQALADSLDQCVSAFRWHEDASWRASVDADVPEEDAALSARLAALWHHREGLRYLRLAEEVTAALKAHT